MRRSNIKRILKRVLLFTPLLLVILTFGRLFIFASNTIFISETELAAKVRDKTIKGNYSGSDRKETNEARHMFETGKAFHVAVNGMLGCVLSSFFS